MAIAMSTTKHIKSFPNKVASMMGTNGHVYNLVLGANADNGTLAKKGAYVSFDQYAAAAVDNGFAGVILEKAVDGTWYIEVTALPETGALYVYNSPVSPYSEAELQDEGLFYNANGDVVQGAPLMLGDVFTISVEGFTGTPVAGKAVSYSAGKYVVAQ